ncbi:ArpU family phage packaging/lysis transcriptional regulator, partial [Enterococcus faecalis]
MILLLKEVDFRQTKANARNVLKSFRRLERIAGRSLIDLKSPIITEMPKSQSHGNKTEDALVQLADAEAERDAILSALMALS